MTLNKANMAIRPIATWMPLSVWSEGLWRDQQGLEFLG